MHTKEITVKERFIFALGDLYGGGGQTIIGVLYLVFITNVIGIGPGIAGTMIMISKGWDAINDPLMGMITDRTHSKMGRRRPFIFIGGILLIPALALLWLPHGIDNTALKVVYMLVTYLFYYTINTIIAVPYSAMSTEITNDFSERNKVNLTRLIFSMTATAICTLVPTMLFESYTAGNLSILSVYFILVFIFGGVFSLPLILIGLFTKERTPYEAVEKFKLESFLKPLSVKGFRKLIVLYICQALALDMASAVVIYYGLYVVNISSTIFLGTFLGMQLLMFPLLYKLVSSVSKTKIYYFGLPLTILMSLGIAFFPTGGAPILLYVLVGLAALGFSGAQLMSWILFPDVVDLVELKLKERNTGVCSGVMTFIRTASAAIAIFIIGWVLELTGFITPTELLPEPIQPDSAILGIRFIFLLGLGILMLFAFLVSRTFKLTPDISKDIKSLNEKLATNIPWTPEEQQRAESYQKEFC
ncbi:MFS transporter [Paracholeplasma manati]|uniref:MFS transporter n=1 Tax=Paracholeplasma manati TaxID=591373 RepID=UPI002408234E|nr:MFS transporter [Paracholeplasma manati]MDG0889596.1 MFS transporter [Paracholeplasma manati]